MAAEQPASGLSRLEREVGAARDGTDVEVVASPPSFPALEIADFDAFGLSGDIGGFAVDTPLGILATGNGVLDETASFMIIDGSIDVYVK